MAEMLSLLADNGYCFLVEKLFLEQLPEDICLQLSNDDFTNQKALATKPEILWIANQQATTTINKVITTKRQDDHHTCCTTTKLVGFLSYTFGDDAKTCKPLCHHPAAPKIATVTT